ncbi:MAG TPA: hypothetical protein VIT92_10565 [Burkholderiaceae bacterium]
MKPVATSTQLAVFDWICGYMLKHGYSPSLDEISAEFGYRSQNSALCHIQALTRKGYLTSKSGVARSIVILRKPVGHNIAEQIARAKEVLAMHCPEALREVAP